MPSVFVIIAVSVVLATALAAGATYPLQNASAPLQNTTLASPSEIQVLVGTVAHNSIFMAAENGTSYQFVSYAELGTVYRNGTTVSGELVLYFDHCAPGSQCGTIYGHPIISQLQIYTTMAGRILSIHSITNLVLLNMYFG